jgi:hypothetical protein
MWSQFCLAQILAHVFFRAPTEMFFVFCFLFLFVKEVGFRFYHTRNAGHRPAPCGQGRGNGRGGEVLGNRGEQGSVGRVCHARCCLLGLVHWCLALTIRTRFSNNISERRINETDSTGWTALHWAASRSRVSGALCPGVHAGVFSGLCWPRTAVGRAHNPTERRVVDVVAGSNGRILAAE